MRIIPLIDGLINRLDRIAIWPWCWFDKAIGAESLTVSGEGLQYTLPPCDRVDYVLVGRLDYSIAGRTQFTLVANGY